MQTAQMRKFWVRLWQFNYSCPACNFSF